MNRFYDLPKELIIEIWNFDRTSADLFRIVLAELRASYIAGRRRNYIFKPSKIFGKYIVTRSL